MCNNSLEEFRFPLFLETKVPAAIQRYLCELPITLPCIFYPLTVCISFSNRQCSTCAVLAHQLTQLFGLTIYSTILDSLRLIGLNEPSDMLI
jgi:hypothetical protein